MSGAKWALGDRVLLEDFCCNLQKWPRKRSVFQCKKELFMTCFQLPLCSFWQWFCAEATPTELLIDDRNDQVSFLRRSLQDPAVNTTWNLTHLRQTAQSESIDHCVNTCQKNSACDVRCFNVTACSCFQTFAWPRETQRMLWSLFH